MQSQRQAALNKHATLFMSILCKQLFSCPKCLARNMNTCVPNLIHRLIVSLVKNEKKKEIQNAELEHTYFPTLIQQRLHDGMLTF